MSRPTKYVSLALFVLISLGTTLFAHQDPPAPEEALKKVLPELNFNHVPLADAIKFVSEITKANILVDWDALKDAGVTRDTPVMVELKNMTLADVLKAILECVGARQDLDYRVDGKSIRISTAAKLEEDAKK